MHAADGVESQIQTVFSLELLSFWTLGSYRNTAIINSNHTNKIAVRLAQLRAGACENTLACTTLRHIDIYLDHEVFPFDMASLLQAPITIAECLSEKFQQ